MPAGWAMNERIFETQPREFAVALVQVEGAIPDGLAGTLLAALPGQQQVGPDPLNFFDGHALVVGVTLGPTPVAAARYVSTPVRAEELEAGRMTRRRLFTNLPARWRNLFALVPGNSGMHDVYAWGGRVYAGNDPGHFAMDPSTLDTLGPADWGGLATPGWEMSPMPYRDPATGRLIGWLKRQGGLRPDALRFVELGEDLTLLASSAVHPLGAAPAIVHDQRATGRWYVATEAPARLDAASAAWGARTIWESLRFPSGRTVEVLLAPRGREGALVRVAIPGAVIAFHLINAYDDGERVVVDLCCYEAPLRFPAAAGAALRARVGAVPGGPVPTPRRFVIDPAAGAVVESRALGQTAMEAPEVSDAVMGAPYRYAYSAAPTGRADEEAALYPSWSGLQKLDVSTGVVQAWAADGAVAVSPPAFVARPGGVGEDDGWLVALVHGAEAGLVVLDARDLRAGPLARVWLGFALPGVSHVRFAPDVCLRA